MRLGPRSAMELMRVLGSLNCTDPVRQMRLIDRLRGHAKGRLSLSLSMGQAKWLLMELTTGRPRPGRPALPKTKEFGRRVMVLLAKINGKVARTTRVP